MSRCITCGDKLDAAYLWDIAKERMRAFIRWPKDWKFHLRIGLLPRVCPLCVIEAIIRDHDDDECPDEDTAE